MATRSIVSWGAAVIRNPHARIFNILSSFHIDPPWVVLAGGTVLAAGGLLLVRAFRMKRVPPIG